MAFWNTVFVEVPLATFNPVKTVSDLLRPQHLPSIRKASDEQAFRLLRCYGQDRERRRDPVPETSGRPISRSRGASL